MTGKKIVVLGTGGTIAGRATSGHDNVGYEAGQVGVGTLLEGLGVLEGLAVVSEQLAQIDSKDMGFDVWGRLALRCAALLQQEGVEGIVITHGTDTLEETVFFLQQVLGPEKPVAVTGAMRPATSTSPDGPQNLRDAIAVAASPGAKGVVAVFAGTIHGPAEVAKAHPYRLDPFVSADAGPIGYVEEGRLRCVRPWPAGRAAQADRILRCLGGTPRWPRVEIVMNHAGADGRLVEALVAQGVDGIVAAGTGNGTLNAALESALLEAEVKGVRVVRTSRCAAGQVVVHAGDRLQAVGLPPVKARIAMMLELIA